MLEEEKQIGDGSCSVVSFGGFFFAFFFLHGLTKEKIMVLGQLALTTFSKRKEYYFVSPDDNRDIGNYPLLVTTGCSHVPLLRCPGGHCPLG